MAHSGRRRGALHEHEPHRLTLEIGVNLTEKEPKKITRAGVSMRRLASARKFGSRKSFVDAGIGYVYVAREMGWWDPKLR